MSKFNTIAAGVAGLAGAVFLIAATPAEADQSFVCKDGSAITVAPEQLAEMKRTNACVASYYGKTIAPKKAPKVENKSAKSSAGKAKARVKLRATKQVKRSRSNKNSHAQLMISAHRPSGSTPTTAVNTDYRNVRILNAKPGGRAVYIHRH
jgi:hypothetical protein